MATETCGAGREVKLDYSPSGDGPLDNFIIKADLETFSDGDPGHYLGVGNAAGVVRKCNRCTGLPGRGCDLSYLNWTKLEPQPETP